MKHAQAPGKGYQDFEGRPNALRQGQTGIAHAKVARRPTGYHEQTTDKTKRGKRVGDAKGQDEPTRGETNAHLVGLEDYNESV